MNFALKVLDFVRGLNVKTYGKDAGETLETVIANELMVFSRKLESDVRAATGVFYTKDIEFLVWLAMQNEEISEGRALEILNWRHSRVEFRALMDAIGEERAFDAVENARNRR